MEETCYRLTGYDYSNSRSYMVTLKLHPQAAALSTLAPTRKLKLAYTQLTQPFIDVLTRRLPIYFHGKVHISRFVIMPNHLHILIWLKPLPKNRRLNLIQVVEQLIRFLIEAYELRMGKQPFQPIDANWHDTILFTEEARMRAMKYIDRNPIRACVRTKNTYCTRHTFHSKDGKLWYFYGNRELLLLPSILAVDCSRKILPETPLWDKWRESARLITPDGAGIGTFMSPCEKMVREEILASGGSLIIMLPEGITSYWHPGEELEKLCAEGRILFLTPFEVERGRISAKELAIRCHPGGGLKEAMAKIACNLIAPPREP